MSIPVLYGGVRIRSQLSLEEVAEILSNWVFGGIPFGGRDQHIRDESPAVFIDTRVLGMSVVLMEVPDDEGYRLSMNPQYALLRLSAEELKCPGTNIDRLVARLLEGVEGLTVCED